jgi:hypothetical protein
MTKLVDSPSKCILKKLLQSFSTTLEARTTFGQDDLSSLNPNKSFNVLGDLLCATVNTCLTNMNLLSAFCTVPATTQPSYGNDKLFRTKITLRAAVVILNVKSVQTIRGR